MITSDRSLLWGMAVPALLAGQAPTARDSTGARDPRVAQPERPTVATHAGTVARDWLELESGVEADRGPGDVRNTTFVTVAKLGVGSRTQLSLSLSASLQERGKGRLGGGGVGDASVGLKWRLAEAHPLLGDFAIQPMLKLPTGKAREGTGTGTTDASLLLISSRDAGPVHIDVNGGYTVRGGDGTSAPRDQWAWTASFGGVFAGKTGWVAEVYGSPGTGGPAGASPLVGFLFGPTFTARDWLVLDVGAIVPVAGDQPRAMYAGATYNLGRIF